MGALFNLIGRIVSSFSRDNPSVRVGDTTAMARLGAEAFGKGRVVEAVYWLVLADLSGFQNLDRTLAEYAAEWIRQGSPDQRELVSDDFTDEQRQFGLAALRWLSGAAREAARAWFSAAIKSGNRDARDFLAKYAR